jgi:hypothetical protein
MELLNAKVSVYKKGIIKYHAVGTVPKSNRIIIEKYPYTQSVTLAAPLDIIHLYVTLQSADKTSSPSCNIFVFM